MGSLSSAPRAPVQTVAAQPVVYTVSTPTPTPTSTPTPETGGAAATPNAAAANKNENLLERRRGITSTILTGFRGLLSQGSETGAQRKTLLGE